MTDADLRALCARHGMKFKEARDVRELIRTDLVQGAPRGVMLKPHHVGPVMEISAHLHSLFHEGPYEDGEFWATGKEVVRMLRRMAALPEERSG